MIYKLGEWPIKKVTLKELKEMYPDKSKSYLDEIEERASNLNAYDNPVEINNLAWQDSPRVGKKA